MNTDGIVVTPFAFSANSCWRTIPSSPSEHVRSDSMNTVELEHANEASSGANPPFDPDIHPMNGTYMLGSLCETLMAHA